MTTTTIPRFRLCRRLAVLATGLALLVSGCASSTADHNTHATQTPVPRTPAAAATGVAKTATPAPLFRNPTPVPTTPPTATAASKLLLSSIPPYTTVRSKRTSLLTRLRFEVDVVVPDEYDRAQVATVLVDAVKKTLNSTADIRAVVGYALTDASHVDNGFDKGRAFASRDGQGWSGDGTWATALYKKDEKSKAFLTLGAFFESPEDIVVDAA